MDYKEKELLAQFHHTISEQLNARLSESPKFFGLLVVVSTAYGYVLAKSDLKPLLVLASLLSYVAVLWASWYLVALGFAFRFLQYCQHRIEHELEWNPQYVPRPRKRESDWRTAAMYRNPGRQILATAWYLPCSCGWSGRLSRAHMRGFLFPLLELLAVGRNALSHHCRQLHDGLARTLFNQPNEFVLLDL